MSLSLALYSAASSLSSQQTLSRLTADNIANATTEGYTRRSGLITTTQSGGAIVSEVRREVDQSLVRMARQENAKMSEHQAIYEGLRDYTIFLGNIGDGTSPAERFSDFNAALTTLVNMPSSSGAQSGAIFAAEELAGSIRDASDRLANLRADVDMEIRYEVADLNDKLYQLADLNARIRDFEPGTFESAQFSDELDQVLDDVSSIVDIRVNYSQDGQVYLYTTGGAALLEGDRIQDVTFNAGDGTFYAGDQEITPNKAGIRGIEHGTLSGFATLRNQTIPEFQLQLDEYARGLIEAFEGADASLAVGQAGFFTDGGYAFDPLNLDGLASRLQVNEVVYSGAGGASWMIRDGLGAVAEGDAADSTQIQAFIDALTNPMNADPATGINASVTLADYGAEMVTYQGTVAARAESDYNAARSAAEVVEASRSNISGVNIDEELQNLMLIEQSYAANSKMLTAIGEMLDTLLAAV